MFAARTAKLPEPVPEPAPAPVTGLRLDRNPNLNLNLNLNLRLGLDLNRYDNAHDNDRAGPKPGEVGPASADARAGTSSP